jgi:hypothetical protein
MRRTILTVIFVGGLLVLTALVSRRLFFSVQKVVDVTVTSAPTIQQIREIGELTVLKVPVRDVVTARIEGFTGGNSLVLIVHGEVGIGIDLEQAKYVEIDKTNRTAVLQVPSPKVLYAKLDHDHTRIHSLTRTGFWQAAIGSAGEDQLVDEAMGHAQRVLVEAGSDPALAQRAREQAQRIIGGLFDGVGWEVTLRW